MTYTNTQLAAWKWLPEDGGLRATRNVALIAALESLMHSTRILVVASGRYPGNFRLAPAGIAERARLVSEGLIE
jgi:hypothetical protein